MWQVLLFWFTLIILIVLFTTTANSCFQRKTSCLVPNSKQTQLPVDQLVNSKSSSFAFLDRIEGFAEQIGKILALTDVEINEAVFTVPDPAGTVILFIHQSEALTHPLTLMDEADRFIYFAAASYTMYK